MTNSLKPLFTFIDEVGGGVMDIVEGWDRMLVIEGIGIVVLATFLGCAGVPLPVNITIACWPFIIFNLLAACWNMR